MKLFDGIYGIQLCIFCLEWCPGVFCGVRDRIKEYHLSLSFMDFVKGD
jgi:hypothetical protein